MQRDGEHVGGLRGRDAGGDEGAGAGELPGEVMIAGREWLDDWVALRAHAAAVGIASGFGHVGSLLWIVRVFRVVGECVLRFVVAGLGNRWGGRLEWSSQLL